MAEVGVAPNSREGSRRGPVQVSIGDGCAPRLTCRGCEHLGIHDWHYFYCSAQAAASSWRGENDQTYPWPGAGKQLRDCVPDAGCPYTGETES